MTSLPTANLPVSLLGDVQYNRTMRLRFPRADGPDAMLVVNRLDAHEALSRDFVFDVELLSDVAAIPLKAVIGKLVTVELVRSDGSLRYFNGYAFRFSESGTDGGLVRYQLQLRPWLAFLSLRRDHYLFHDKTVYDQTLDTLNDYPAADWTIRDLGDDPVMTDACQYGETDYNYLHRRWEERGWCYHYEHRFDGHTLVLSGDTRSSDPLDLEPMVRWQSAGGSEEDDAVAQWSTSRQMMPSQYAAAAFDFKSPTPNLRNTTTLNQQGDVPALEIYDYAGALGFQPADSGDDFARLRMEEIETAAKTFAGGGNCRRLQPGRWFSLSEHYDDGDNEFLIEEIQHHAVNNYQGGAGSTEYRNQFRAQRKAVVWRPTRGRNSHAPRIYGLQTATVVGPAGEEIHTDEFGRVRVQFHWDREGQYDEKSSAWVRVASQWAGGGYGFMSVPRIGQEVVVQFLEGNPDRPLITGCVYNQANAVPWSLPGANHQTGIRTLSTPGGNGYCEIAIHDQAGSELINVHAQKDMVTTVLNNDSTSVGASQSLSVGANQSTVVSGEQRTVTVTDGTQITTVKKAVIFQSQTANVQTVAHTAIELLAETDFVHVEGATQIALQCGQASLILNQDGTVELKGTQITVNGARVDINP